MPTVTIHVSDEQAALIASTAAEENLSVTEFIDRKMRAGLTKAVMQSVNKWPSLFRWDEMARGHDCPVCEQLAQGTEANDDGFWVADLAITRLRLQRNQFIPGYCVLTSLQHAREPYELTEENQRLYFDDLMRVGRAIDRAMRPVKMNFEIQGNGVPHLHCHVKPRYHGDIAPGIPIDQNADTHLLLPDEYADRVKVIRSFL